MWFENFMEYVFSVKRNTGKNDGLFELMILGFVCLFVGISWKTYQILTDTVIWSRADFGLLSLGVIAGIIFLVYHKPKRIGIRIKKPHV